MSLQQDNKLKYVALLAGAIAVLHLFNLLFFNMHDLKKVNGRVSSLHTYGHFGTLRGTRGIYYTTVSFMLDGRGKEYYETEGSSRDTSMLQLKEGEQLEVYTNRWYQLTFYFYSGANIYLVKKDGQVIYDLTEPLKRNNKKYFFIFGSIALVFTLMYLDQVKNISISNLFWKNTEPNKKGIQELEEWRKGE